jgi:hypothetical protein
VRGNVVLGQLRAAEELVGAEMVERALAQLAPEIAAELRSALAISWCSLDSLRAFHEAIAPLANEELAAWRARVVELATRQTFSTTLRFFMRLTTKDALIKRTAGMYAKIFDRGTLTPRTSDDGILVLQLTGWPDAAPFHLDGVATGILAILKLAKIESVKLKWTRTHDGADFEIRASR